MTACPLTRSTNATSATRRSWARHVGATPASSRRSCPLHGWLFVCLVQSRASAIAVHLHALLSSPSSQLEAAMKQQQQRQQQQRRGIWRASPAATPLRCPALPACLPACPPCRSPSPFSARCSACASTRRSWSTRRRRRSTPQTLSRWVGGSVGARLPGACACGRGRVKGGQGQRGRGEQWPRHGSRGRCACTCIPEQTIQLPALPCDIALLACSVRVSTSTASPAVWAPTQSQRGRSSAASTWQRWVGVRGG